MEFAVSKQSVIAALEVCKACVRYEKGFGKEEGLKDIRRGGEYLK